MSTCPIPCLEFSPTPSHMPKPNVRKIYSFQNKRFLFSETYYRVSLKSIGQPSEANCWVILRNSHRFASEMNCWTTLQGNSSENLPRNSFHNHFHFSFIFFCHALTPIILGCPDAYGMHYAISKQFMLIYFRCIYYQN